MQRRQLPENRSTHVAVSAEAGQRGSGALGTRIIQEVVARQQRPIATVERVPGRFRRHRRGQKKGQVTAAESLRWNREGWEATCFVL